MQSNLKRSRVGKAPNKSVAQRRLANAVRSIQRNNIAPGLVRAGGRLPSAAGELKNVDATSTALIVAAQTTATLALLNGITQDSTANGRIGRRVTLKSLYVRFQMSLAPTTAGNSPIRLMIVYDKQTNAAALTAAQVLQADAIVNPNLLDNSRRFVTLMDWESDGIGTAGPGAIHHTFYKKLNLPMEFNTGTTNVVGSIVTGSIYVLAYQNGQLITANPTQAFYSRIRFLE